MRLKLLGMWPVRMFKHSLHPRKEFNVDIIVLESPESVPVTKGSSKKKNFGIDLSDNQQKTYGKQFAGTPTPSKYGREVCVFFKPTKHNDDSFGNFTCTPKCSNGTGTRIGKSTTTSSFVGIVLTHFNLIGGDLVLSMLVIQNCRARIIHPFTLCIFRKSVLINLSHPPFSDVFVSWMH